jgi:hypothetical protein
VAPQRGKGRGTPDTSAVVAILVDRFSGRATGGSGTILARLGNDIDPAELTETLLDGGEEGEAGGIFAFPSTTDVDTTAVLIELELGATCTAGDTTDAAVLPDIGAAFSIYEGPAPALTMFRMAARVSRLAIVREVKLAMAHGGTLSGSPAQTSWEEAWWLMLTLHDTLVAVVTSNAEAIPVVQSAWLERVLEQLHELRGKLGLIVGEKDLDGVDAVIATLQCENATVDAYLGGCFGLSDAAHRWTLLGHMQALDVTATPNPSGAGAANAICISDGSVRRALSAPAR